MPGRLQSCGASDAEFVAAFDLSNTAEIDLAKYVFNRSKDPAIRQFAQEVIVGHSMILSNLAIEMDDKTLRTEVKASRLGLRWIGFVHPTRGSDQMDDAEFMRLQVPIHRRALALLQWESQNGQNVNLKNHVGRVMLPMVQHHLEDALEVLAMRRLTPPDWVPGLYPAPTRSDFP